MLKIRSERRNSIKISVSSSFFNHEFVLLDLKALLIPMVQKKYTNLVKKKTISLQS